MNWSRVLCVGLVGLGTLQAAAQEAEKPDQLGIQVMNILVQIQPEDFGCVDAHQGHFGNDIPGRISFYPRKGNTGWWVNKITDYDERLTRIESFSKVLSATEKCSDFEAELPRRNRYLDFERRVIGHIEQRGDQAVGFITEAAKMTLRPGLELVGQFTWIDWSIPLHQWDPQIPFSSGLINEFTSFEHSIGVQGRGPHELNCRSLGARAEMVYEVNSSPKTNVTELRRAYASLDECWTAVTKLSQTLEAEGRTWLGISHEAKRSLWSSQRRTVQGCDRIRVERLEVEIENLKFVGTRFIPLSSGLSHCR